MFNDSTKKIGRFLGRYHLSITTASRFLLMASLYIWNALPAPYNMVYRFKLATQNPTFICRDGVYSFAVTRRIPAALGILAIVFLSIFF